MKKLWDKPIKAIIYATIVLLFATIIPRSSGEVTRADDRIQVEVSIIQSSIEEPVLPEKYKRAKPLSEREIIDIYARTIAIKYNIEPELIMSIIQQESEYHPNAKNGSCLGLMQVSSYWHADRAKRLGVTNFYDSYSNILLGVDYISELMSKYKDPALVLMLYNMDHKTAFTMYSNGQISSYARTVLSRAELYKRGERGDYGHS